MYSILVVLEVLVSVALVGLILIQHGKGADAGAAFGSGASGTVFGSRGSANFLSRATAWLATVFFCLSLALAYLVHGQRSGGSIIDKVQGEAPTAIQPANPAIPDEAPEQTPSGAPAVTEPSQQPVVPE